LGCIVLGRTPVCRPGITISGEFPFDCLRDAYLPVSDLAISPREPGKATIEGAVLSYSKLTLTSGWPTILKNCDLRGTEIMSTGIVLIDGGQVELTPHGTYNVIREISIMRELSRLRRAEVAQTSTWYWETLWKLGSFVAWVKTYGKREYNKEDFPVIEGMLAKISKKGADISESSYLSKLLTTHFTMVSSWAKGKSGDSIDLVASTYKEVEDSIAARIAHESAKPEKKKLYHKFDYGWLPSTEPDSFG
jgi:hypothetical protein